MSIPLQQLNTTQDSQEDLGHQDKIISSPSVSLSTEPASSVAVSEDDEA